ncbi:MAG: AraC family transcriptional regulator [Clostridia bacterium]|nr:AraC family transcriptional regulator [Clostridia bacterium]
MFRDEFKKRYTTIPLAIDRGRSTSSTIEVITHQHKEVELISMTEGSAVFFIDSQSYSIKKGDILLIPPYALHRAHTSSAEPTAYYCICFDLSLLCDRCLQDELETQAICTKGLIEGESKHAERLQKYIEDAFLACENKETGWEMIASGNMSLLFGVLKQNGFFSRNTRSQKSVNLGKDVMKYIITHYASGVSSRDAAKELHMEHSFFCRSFKKTFGCCFTDYILAYRLEKAKVLLRSSDLSVTEIAFKVGFNDCSYFCKVFKKGIGSSPLCYRKAEK